MTDHTRHADEGRYLTDFAAEVWVKCFRCLSPGLVQARRDDWGWHAHFDCKSCDVALDSARRDWIGPVIASGRRPCGYCGYQWLKPRIRQAEWPREVLISIEVECPECSRTTVVKLTTQKAFDPTECLDPHFGMPLWLVDVGRHGALWVYNVDHLQMLKAYVGATLRERGRSAGNASLLSRLPAWVKAAKNRDAVIKRLDRLGNQLATTESF